MEKAFQLWAKTGKAPDAWHALPYHLLDVGAVADVLYDRLPTASRTAWERASGAGKPFPVFAAAGHDVGKANPYFQYKAPDQRVRLEAAGFPLRDREPHRHGQATCAYLSSWLTNQGWSAEIAWRVAVAIGGHHGRFIVNDKRISLGLNNMPWLELGPAILAELADLFPHKAPPFPRPNPALAWLAGFVSIADWLGSHEDMVSEGCREPQDLREYLSVARERARLLLDRLNLREMPDTPRLNLATILGDRPSRPLQDAAAEVAEKDWRFALIEAPTGEGKTEAAFVLSEGARKRESAGSYFALPTMATANGLFGRVVSFVADVAGDKTIELRLLHGKACLSDEFARYRENPGEEDRQGPVASQWFDGSKRGLIAPYGVGTIDQVLLASLKVKHGFVRLFALAGKTVVLDEVHAYDLYMSNLLDRLLEWLNALGSRVVLLSATLPSARRDELLAAWGATSHAEGSNYPCLTWIDEAGVVTPVPFGARRRKPIRIELGDSIEEEESRMLEIVARQGGCGAILRNTVSEAQSSFERLRFLAKSRGVEVLLFHARFTARDRDRIEREALERFGPDAKSERRQRVILVATQVVEQSLDLDFDHMVSTLCPMDLLIQRAGRLHRHVRAKDGRRLDACATDERGEAILRVTGPLENETAMYSAAVIVRTEERLSRGPVMLVDAMDTATAVSDAYSELNPEEAEADYLRRVGEALEQDQAKAETLVGAARNVRLPFPNSENAFFVSDRHDADDAEDSPLFAQTRFEERPSLEAAILWKTSAGLALEPHGEPVDLGREPRGGMRRNLEMAKLRIASTRDLRELPRPPLLGGAVQIVVEPDGRCTVGASHYRYDGDFGFRKEDPIA